MRHRHRNTADDKVSQHHVDETGRKPVSQDAPPTIKRNTVAAFRALVALPVVIGVVGPICYAQGGSVGLAVGGASAALIFVTAILSIRYFKEQVTTLAVTFVSILSGLEMGLITPYVISEPLGLTLGIVVGCMMGTWPPLFITAIAGYRHPSEVDSTYRLSVIRLSGIVGVGIVAVKYKQEYDIGVPGAFTHFCVALISASVVDQLLIRPGTWLGAIVSRALLELSKLAIYVRIAAPGLVAFAVGYLLLCVIYASWYWATWKYFGNDEFAGDSFLKKAPEFWTFLYFSIVTMGTLGYGYIVPAGPLARILATSQLILSVGWVTVVFALVMAKFQVLLSGIEPSESKLKSIDQGDETASHAGLPLRGGN